MAPVLALRGPDGSLHDAILGMQKWTSFVIVLFLSSILLCAAAPKTIHPALVASGAIALTSLLPRSQAPAWCTQLVVWSHANRDRPEVLLLRHRGYPDHLHGVLREDCREAICTGREQCRKRLFFRRPGQLAKSPVSRPWVVLP